jgi:hypothetical protein
MTWTVAPKGSWGIATTDTPADMDAALALAGSWPIDQHRAYVRRDQWDALGPGPPPGGPPTLTSITPNQGPVDGGTQSALQGTGLTGATHVFYGSNPATSFDVVNDTTITAVSPPGAAGAVNVAVMRGVASNAVPFDYQ